MTARTCLPVLILILALAMLACGGGSDVADPAVESPDTPAPVSTPDSGGQQTMVAATPAPGSTPGSGDQQTQVAATPAAGSTPDGGDQQTMVAATPTPTDEADPFAGNGGGPGQFASVSAGWNQYTCGVRADGSAVCWGWDRNGRTMPPEGSFAHVSTGYKHVCGLKTDGSVACWGDNYYGHATPPEGNFISVSAEQDYNCGGEDRWLRPLLGIWQRGLGPAYDGGVCLCQRRGIPRLRSEDRRFRRVLGKRLW